MKGTLTHSVSYRAPSRVVGGRYVVETAGGRSVRQQADHPVFFDGFLTEPVQSALGLGAVARVARTRYHDPSLANSLRDPVVTCGGDRLRFESFSGCAGVYARLDVLPGGLDGEIRDRGTTNVDFNVPFTDALAKVAPADPVRLRVGPDEVALATLDESVVERRVELPRRWLRGFAEVSVLMPGWAPRAELSGPEARQFLRSLPVSGGRLWAVPSGRTLRLTTTPGPGAVSVSGPDRLAELAPLLRFATGLRIYGPDVGAGVRVPPVPSAWELTLRHARFVLLLSPERHRGLSGEGAVLEVTGFAGVLLALPHHREVVAAATVPLACAMSGRLGAHTRRVVTGLPGAGGPAGPATALVIAYAALSPHATDRTAAVDALLGFVATDELAAAVFGDVLLLLFELDIVTVNRLTEVLAEVVRAGPAGAEFVWRSVLRFLPAVLADPPRGIPELLETCTDAVLRCHARDRLPELDALADRKGTNRTTAEARRLREALTRP